LASFIDSRAAVWLVLLCVALPMRLVWVGDDFIREHAWNEGHYACATRNLSRYGLLDQRDDMGRDRTFSPFVPILLWPTARLSGWKPWGFRAPLVVSGLLTLGLFHALMRRRWGVEARTAWLALLLASTASGIFYFSRNVQLDGVATALLLGALWGVGHDSRRARALGWICWACCPLAKTTFLLYTPIIILAAAERDGLSPLRRRAWLKALLPAALGTLPIAMWLTYCFLDRPAMIAGFLTRTNVWTRANLAAALRMTPIILYRQLTPPIILFGLLGLIPFLRGRVIAWRRMAVPLYLAGSWVIFIFTHPRPYIANQYYTYPALYLACLLGAGGLAWVWAPAARRLARGGVMRPALAVAGLALITALGVRATVRHYGFVAIDPAIIAEGLGKKPDALPPRLFSAYGVDVFKEARLLAARAPRGGKILVDYPSTMFYAGGDPARVDCSYGGVAGMFDPRVHKGVLVSCVLTSESAKRTEDLVRRLRGLGWKQISPRAWIAP